MSSQSSWSLTTTSSVLCRREMRDSRTGAVRSKPIEPWNFPVRAVALFLLDVFVVVSLVYVGRRGDCFITSILQTQRSFLPPWSYIEDWRYSCPLFSFQSLLTRSHLSVWSLYTYLTDVLFIVSLDRCIWTLVSHLPTFCFPFRRNNNITPGKCGRFLICCSETESTQVDIRIGVSRRFEAPFRWPFFILFCNPKWMTKRLLNSDYLVSRVSFRVKI